MIRRALGRWYAARDMAAARDPQRCPVSNCRSMLRVGEVQEVPGMRDGETGLPVLACADHDFGEAP